MSSALSASACLHPRILTPDVVLRKFLIAFASRSLLFMCHVHCALCIVKNSSTQHTARYTAKLHVTPRSLAQGATHRYQRLIPWLRGQFWFKIGKFDNLPALKHSLCIHFVFCSVCDFASKGGKQKMTRLRRRMKNRSKKKKKTIWFLVCRLAKEQRSFGTRYTRAMLGGCLLAPLLAFSSLPPYFLFFSLSLLLFLLPSSFWFQKPIWGRARQEGGHADGTGGI